MKTLIPIIIGLLVVGCGKDNQPKQKADNETPLKGDGKNSITEKPVKELTPEEQLKPPKAVPTKLIADSIVEKAIRESLKKPTGELTKTDLENADTLYLGGSGITDAGLKEVAKLEKLTKLYLGGTKITDGGLKAVANLQQLTTLYLSSQITATGAAELSKALPNCKIYGYFK